MKKKFKVNLAFIKKHPVGSIIELDVDKDGVPFNLFWKRRFDDSKIDNCISPVKEPVLKTEEKSK